MGHLAEQNACSHHITGPDMRGFQSSNSNLTPDARCCCCLDATGIDFFIQAWQYLCMHKRSFLALKQLLLRILLPLTLHDRNVNDNHPLLRGHDQCIHRFSSNLGTLSLRVKKMLGILLRYLTFSKQKQVSLKGPI